MPANEANAPLDRDRRIDYIELPATDVARGKRFYQDVFGWSFTDYGPGYTSFEDGRLAGGLTKEGRVAKGGALVVIYARDLEAMEKRVRDAGRRDRQTDLRIPWRAPLPLRRSERQRAVRVVGR